MTEDRVALYVRLPRQQVAALDELVSATGRRKQQLVSELLADRLGTAQVESTPIGDLADERHGADVVLTLEDVAALLRVSTEAVLARVSAGELPGRRLGDEWRFARRAVMTWLADGERSESRGAGFGWDAE